MKRLLILISSILIITPVYAEEYGILPNHSGNVNRIVSEEVNNYIENDNYIVRQEGAYTYYDDTNYNDIYMEVKNGKEDHHERFEAMAGLPSKEWLHTSIGVRGMHATTTLETYQVGKRTDADIFGASFLVQIPWYTSKETCKVIISYSGGGVSSITLTNGEHSTLDTWVSQQTTNANNWCEEWFDSIHYYNEMPSSCEPCFAPFLHL